MRSTNPDFGSSVNPVLATDYSLLDRLSRRRVATLISSAALMLPITIFATPSKPERICDTKIRNIATKINHRISRVLFFMCPTVQPVRSNVARYRQLVYDDDLRGCGHGELLAGRGRPRRAAVHVRA